MDGRLKFYGWGAQNTGLDEAERGRLFRFLHDRFKIESRLAASPQVTDIALRDPRVTPPRSIAHLFQSDPY